MVLRCLPVRRRRASSSVHRMSDAQHTHDREIKNLSIFFILYQGLSLCEPDRSLACKPAQGPICAGSLCSPTLMEGAGKPPRPPGGGRDLRPSQLTALLDSYGRRNPHCRSPCMARGHCSGLKPLGAGIRFADLLPALHILLLNIK